MANELLNKLKLIDNSRETLHSMLTNKGITVTKPSFPNLVSAVNNLSNPDVPTEKEWDGVPEEPEPEYWKPDNLEELKQIYETDADKDNYSIAAFMIYLADATSDKLPADAICGFDNFKFSDSDSIDTSHTNNHGNNDHTWDKAKDIDIGGIKYRWVIGYTDTWLRTFDLDNSKANPYIVYVPKGEYSEIIFGDNYATPAYVEIGAEVTSHSGDSISITRGGTGICIELKTFISNSPHTQFTDSCFKNCINLEFVKNDGSLTLTGRYWYSYVFSNCYNLKYIHLNYIAAMQECTFEFMHDAYIQIDKIGNNIETEQVIGKTTNGYGDSTGPFVSTESLRVRIGEINGQIHTLAKYDNNNNNLDNNTLNSKNSMELEIETINGNINDRAFISNNILFKGLKINNIKKGNISDNAFSGSALTGIITIGDENEAEAIYTIGGYAFSNCNNLTSVIIQNGYKSIAGLVFNNDTNLNTVELGSITSLAGNVFARL